MADKVKVKVLKDFDSTTYGPLKAGTYPLIDPARADTWAKSGLVEVITANKKAPVVATETKPAKKTATENKKVKDGAAATSKSGRGKKPSSRRA